MSTEQLFGLADGHLLLEGLPPDQARAAMRDRHYDLIVDTSGYTRGSGLPLLAQRCAPLQAHYIGYHATTGLATIDGFIGDGETAAPELQEQFSERLWRLPRPWLAYPIDTPFPKATPLMQTDRPVLGCFCQVGKISDHTLAIWAATLRRVPEAVLVLKDRGLQDEDMRRILEERLTARGVSADRVMLLAPVEEWTDHVDYYNIIDVALDTTPWSSATTGFEALGMGVPLVAFRGTAMAARMSSSLVRALGRNEWIGETAEEIATSVATLCADLPSLRQEKEARQQAALASVLFDGVDLCNSVQDLFETVVDTFASSP
jgi:protein O-GlcNAc transferase